MSYNFIYIYIYKVCQLKLKAPRVNISEASHSHITHLYNSQILSLLILIHKLDQSQTLVSKIQKPIRHPSKN